MNSAFDRIRREVPTAERIFWFDLYDREPEGFRLIDLAPRLDGSVEVVPESAALLEWLRSRVEKPLGGIPPIPFRELVPDITLYFPTEEDVRIVDATSFGPSTWRF
jgi:hypothetical protein